MFDSIIKGFTGIKNIITNIAQIVLVVILIPFVATVVNAIGSLSGDGTQLGGYMIDLMGQIPLFEEVATLMLQSSADLSFSAISTISVKAFLLAFPEAVLVSVCVLFFDKLVAKGRDEKSRPLPIFAPFMGISVATIIVNLLELFKNVLAIILLEVIVIIGIGLAIKSLFIGTKKNENKSKRVSSLKKGLIFVIGYLHGIIATCYAVSVFLVCSGGITGVGNALKFLLPLSILLVVASIIVWLVDKASKAIEA